MSPARPPYEKFGPRRAVRGGMRASTRSGKFGRTWWGRTLVDTVERLADAGRMTRGRTYARAGQVIDLSIVPGKVVAEVQGSQIDPFTAIFSVRVLTDDEVADIAEVVRATPGMLAEIVSGELPEQLGSMLLPKSATELDFACTCPDSGYPCKHVASVVYLTAEHLDRKPVEMLTLRGVDLDTLIGGVQAARSGDIGDPFGDSALLPDLPTPTFVSALEDLDAMLLRRVLRSMSVDQRDASTGYFELHAIYERLR